MKTLMVVALLLAGCSALPAKDYKTQTDRLKQRKCEVVIPAEPEHSARKYDPSTDTTTLVEIRSYEYWRCPDVDLLVQLKVEPKS